MNVLAPLGLGATIFVVTSYADRGSTPEGLKVLSWSQIRKLAEAGFQIGSHTITHPVLNDLSEARLVEEIRDSKRRLEDEVGRQIESFAYPFGQFDHRALEVVGSSGYVRGYGVIVPKPLPLGRYSMQRISITRNDGRLRFLLKTSRPYRHLVEHRYPLATGGLTRLSGAVPRRMAQ